MCKKKNIIVLKSNRLNLSNENKDFITSRKLRENEKQKKKRKKRVKFDDTTYENDSGSYRLLSIFRFRDEFTSVRLTAPVKRVNRD